MNGSDFFQKLVDLREELSVLSEEQFGSVLHMMTEAYSCGYVAGKAKGLGVSDDITGGEIGRAVAIRSVTASGERGILTEMVYQNLAKDFGEAVQLILDGLVMVDGHLVHNVGITLVSGSVINVKRK